MADLEAELFRIGYVLMNIALWIDDDRCPALFIAQEIGSMCETAEIVLFRIMVSASLAPARCRGLRRSYCLPPVSFGKAKAT